MLSCWRGLAGSCFERRNNRNQQQHVARVHPWERLPNLIASTDRHLTFRLPPDSGAPVGRLHMLQLDLGFFQQLGRHFLSSRPKPFRVRAGRPMNDQPIEEKLSKLLLVEGASHGRLPHFMAHCVVMEWHDNYTPSGNLTYHDQVSPASAARRVEAFREGIERRRSA